MDQGTAFCYGQFSDETNDALLVARSERDSNHIILSTAIRTNDVYQRQQGEFPSFLSTQTAIISIFKLHTTILTP